MKKTFLIILIALIVVLSPVVWYLASPLFIDEVVDEDFPISSVSEEVSKEILEEVSEENQDAGGSMVAIYEGNFINADLFHKVSGKAMVISDGDEFYLRFEDFKSINGPDLKVYFSEDLKAKSFVSLGDLKGNVGNQNYLISKDVDFEKYKYVLIWCERFGVLFGSAELRV